MDYTERAYEEGWAEIEGHREGGGPRYKRKPRKAFDINNIRLPWASPTEKQVHFAKLLGTELTLTDLARLNRYQVSRLITELMGRRRSAEIRQAALEARSRCQGQGMARERLAQYGDVPTVWTPVREAIDLPVITRPADLCYQQNDGPTLYGQKPGVTWHVDESELDSPDGPARTFVGTDVHRKPREFTLRGIAGQQVHPHRGDVLKVWGNAAPFLLFVRKAPKGKLLPKPRAKVKPKAVKPPVAPAPVVTSRFAAFVAHLEL